MPHGRCCIRHACARLTPLTRITHRVFPGGCALHSLMARPHGYRAPAEDRANHVEQVLGHLGFRNLREVAALAAKTGLFREDGQGPAQGDQ